MPVMPALPRRTWPLAAIAAGVMAGSWLLIVVAWTLLPTARAVEVVIPPGTAERVARDVRDEYVSPEAAARDYGVVVDPVTFEVDEKETKMMRKR